MRLFAVSLQPISTRVQQSDPVHLPNTLNTYSHVFIKDDPIYPNFTPAYSCPFEVVTRNNHTFKVIKRGKIVSVSINNVKPGFVRITNSSCNDPTNEDVITYSRPHRSINLPCRLRDYIV